VRKILRFDMLSVVRLFVVFYAVIGVYAATKSAIMGEDTVLCPFGFEYPLLYLTVNLTIKLPHPTSWITPFVVFFSVMFYAITGAISGVTFVIVYNISSKYWPGVLAQVKAEERPDEPASGIGLI
jgi:thiol:disulfide interchange protein